jgi:hypothetical protein
MTVNGSKVFIKNVFYYPKSFFYFRDPMFQREFYASQSATQCDSSGWMMVSTANRCYLETDKKPSFYYAPGQTSAHWGYSMLYQFILLNL